VGGAIGNYDTLTVTGSAFTNNIAYYGGAIYNMELVNVENNTFTNNTATSGGALENEGTLNLTASTFTGNNATNGGAIFNDNSSTVDNSTLTNNTANSGGAIFNKNSLTINYSTLTNNTATTHGGAIYNENSGTSIIQFNRITGNRVPDIYNNGGSVNATLNWWGTNFTGTNPINAGRVTSNVATTPWIILNITANPTTILTGGTSNITAELLYDNQAGYHNPANGVVPYIGLITFTTSLGTINNAYMFNGVVNSTLNAGTITGVANVTAEVDNAPVNALVNINNSNAPVAS
jgi:predicted outer membrane repeat protein